MAENSKREQIIQRVEEEVLEIGSIKKCYRKLLSQSDLKNFPVTAFPVCAIVGRLPVPSEKIKGRVPGGVDIIVSKLTIDLIIYFQDRTEPDKTISRLLDDLWVKLYADQLKNGLVLSTILTPREKHEYWPPYGAFKLEVTVTYKHDLGGI